MKTVIIIPTYNEAENIGPLIEALQKVFKKCPQKFKMHILVVDDNSPDGTADIVRQKAKKYSNVHLFLNPKKMGLGGAYKKGMEYAVNKLGADLLFEFDADFSHDPERIPAFLKKIDEGYDLVLGSRYIKGGSIPADWPLIRKFYSVVGNLIIMLVLTDFRIRDWTTGYRAIRKEVFEKVKDQLTADQFSGYTWQIGFLHKTVRAGFKVAEVPIHFVDRKKGKSKLGKEYIKNTLIYIFKTRFFEILHSSFLKFAVVGFTGFVLQTITFKILLDLNLHQSLAVSLAAELAIISNFTLNNIWTFKEKKIKGLKKILLKFLAFNLTSLLAVGIQAFILWLGPLLLGESRLSIWISYFVALTIVMIVNFTIYNRFIWKTHQR